MQPFFRLRTDLGRSESRSDAGFAGIELSPPNRTECLYPEVKGEPKKRFDAYPLGYFHIDIAELRTEEGKPYLFVAIDRTSEFAFVKLVEKADKMAAARSQARLRELAEAVPYTVHTVLTDNRVQVTSRSFDHSAFHHVFDRVCVEHGIEHRLAKVNHPWSEEDQETVRWTVSPTNGQVERMNRTIKEATVRRYHYGSHEQLRSHLVDFVGAYNCARRLESLRRLTPYELIVKCWTEEPQRFRIDPTHHTLGPST